MLLVVYAQPFGVVRRGHLPQQLQRARLLHRPGHTSDLGFSKAALRLRVQVFGPKSALWFFGSVIHS